MYRPSRRQSSAESLPSYGGANASNTNWKTPQSGYTSTPPPAPNNSSPYATHSTQYAQHGGTPSPPNSHSQSNLRPVYPMPNGSPYQQKSAKSKTRAGGVFKLLGYLAVLAIVASGWVFAYQLKKAKTQVSEELADVKGRADEMFKTLGKMQEDVSSKKRELLKVEDKYKGQIKDIKSDFHDGLERLSTMEQREQALMDDSQRLRTFIQMQSKLDTVEKYGEGPFRVYFELGFQEDELRIDEWRKSNPSELMLPDNLRAGPFKFIVKLAPLDLMPHSVHMFLQMISLKLFDGTKFDINPGHVIMTSTNPEQMKLFEDSGYNKLSFSEHHLDYPHNKNTIGFASRPPGPNFYINMRNNEDVHGPGGQSQYVLNEEADPCFGTIIAGFDAIERLRLLPLEGDHYLNPPVIKTAKILKPGE